ncbi:hypothetical protein K501DRAFT_303643 [Backusella circina FSU 941]|nr:hypothetical protein K501DRAFT_303643 [Backusella circina FSU 941]
MLDRLPNEIVEIIVHHLNMTDMIRCKQVCKVWNSKIAYASLIKQFHCSTLTQFNNFVSFCGSNGLDGAIVKKLGLHFPLQQPLPLASIPILFPKVEWLSLKYKNGKNMKERGNLDAFEPWALHLRHLETNYIEGIVPELFTYLQFQHLTSIAIYFNWPNSRYRDVSDFINCLSLVPTLESLKLAGFVVHLSDLEFLHNSTPRLISLTLSEGVVCFHESAMNNLKPATMIKSLTIESHANVNDDEYMSLDYISRKYPNLELLHFNPCLEAFVSPTFIHEGRYTTNFVHLTSKLSKEFKSLTLNSYLFRPSIFKELDKRKVKLNQLSIISPNTAFQQYLFINSIQSYDQFQHIQEFTINNMNIKYTHAIKNMVQLNKITLIHCYGLEQLFSFCPPNLKSLCVDTDDKLSALIAKKPTVLTKLAYLTIQGKEIENTFISFIGRICPRLQSFHLTDSSYRFKNKLFLGFPQRTLKELRIHIKDCFSYFTTRTSKGTRHYAYFVSRNGGTIDRLKSTQFVRISFIIKCRTNPEIWLNDHLLIN